MCLDAMILYDGLTAMLVQSRRLHPSSQQRPARHLGADPGGAYHCREASGLSWILAQVFHAVRGDSNKAFGTAWPLEWVCELKAACCRSKSEIHKAHQHTEAAMAMSSRDPFSMQGCAWALCGSPAAPQINATEI